MAVEQRPMQQHALASSSFIDSSQLERIFRVLIVVSTCSYLLFYFEHLFFGFWISDVEAELLDWVGYESVLEFPPAVNNLLVLLWIAAAVGLYNFSSAARALYAILLGFGCATTLLAGLHASTALAAFLGALCSTCDGAIIALAYFSPLRARFH